MSFRLGIYAVSFLGLGAISWSACSLNPQPLPPPELNAVPTTPAADAGGGAVQFDARASGGDSGLFGTEDSAPPPDAFDASDAANLDAATDAQDARRD
jgi:hypothetical protein